MGEERSKLNNKEVGGVCASKKGREERMGANVTLSFTSRKSRRGVGTSFDGEPQKKVMLVGHRASTCEETATRLNIP